MADARSGADAAGRSRGGGGNPSRLRTAARRRAKAGQEARLEERATAELRSEKSRGPHSRKAHLSMRPVWLGLAIIVLAVVVLMPTPDGLSVSGQRALGILAFAVILWVTEAVSYPVSSVMIIGIMALLLGASPAPDGSGEALGTSDALGYALAGFGSSAVALVAAALALAAGMQATGLHKRIALVVMKYAGEKTSRILIGAIIISIVLAFFVPSATARAGAVVPILIGMVAAFGLPTESRLGALMVITAAQSISIWNIGVQTAAAQNLVAVGFIQESMGATISWPQWFAAGAPWAAVMSVVLYFVMRATIKPEVDRLEGGREIVQKSLTELGPMTGAEKRLAAVAVILLAFWSTQGSLHDIDATTVTLCAIGVMLLPRIGVYSWKTVEELVSWGTLVVFAVGISLGSVLLETGAAAWLSAAVFDGLGITGLPVLAIIAIVGAFTILIHLGFASATSMSSALIPVFIALAVSIPDLPGGGVGFVLIMQFLICFGFLLPISAPQNMLAYGTGAFTTQQFLRTGIPLTIAGYLLILLFSATYWQWIGLL